MSRQDNTTFFKSCLDKKSHISEIYVLGWM
nr:MAG TPA: Chromosome region maintenance protein [Caudoviricetes sp.]